MYPKSKRQFQPLKSTREIQKGWRLSMAKTYAAAEEEEEEQSLKQNKMSTVFPLSVSIIYALDLLWQLNVMSTTKKGTREGKGITETLQSSSPFFFTLELAKLLCPCSTALKTAYSSVALSSAFPVTFLSAIIGKIAKFCICTCQCTFTAWLVEYRLRCQWRKPEPKLLVLQLRQ